MLKVENLNAGYGKGTSVLKGVSLSVTQGECLALMGRNGMGKTLLAKCLIGLIAPNSGSILFQGTQIAKLPAHRVSNLGMAYVPQGREIFAEFTVLENLRMGVIGKPDPKMTRLEQILDWFPILKQRLSQKAGSMSGGQMQQLAIARALISGPKLLVLDEPSEGIQPSIVFEIAEVLRHISQTQGLTILVIEQNIDMVEQLAKRIAVLDHGQINAELSIDQMLAEPELLTRHMGL